MNSSWPYSLILSQGQNTDKYLLLQVPAWSIVFVVSSYITLGIHLNRVGQSKLKIELL